MIFNCRASRCPATVTASHDAIQANFCWEECAETQGGNHECSGDYIPPVPFGGFDLDFGADCPNP